MATKRMFSNVVIDSDSFLDLPPMAQLLYFHCGMKTDDDGFVSGARRISRIIGASDSDFDLLVDSGFLIEFPDSKVFVVVHHRLNNDLKNDRYHGTNYKQEFARLELTENRTYIPKVDTNCIQDVSKEDTEQNVTQRNPKNITQRSEGKGSDEGETARLLVEQCRVAGLDPREVSTLILDHGIETVHDAFLKWREKKEKPIKDFIE